MDSHFHGNDKENNGNDIEKSGNDIERKEIISGTTPFLRHSRERGPLSLTGVPPVYFNISLNNKTFISDIFFKVLSLVINISAFASKEVAT